MDGVLRSEIRFPGHGEDEIGGFLARPDEPGPWPALVVVHEIFGVTDHMRDVAGRFAKEGFVALVPDLWSRSPEAKVPAAAGDPSALGPLAETDLVRLRGFVETQPDARMTGDLAAAARHLRTRPDVRPNGIGTVGFCMGGIYAFHLACEPDAPIRACVDFYGRLVYPKPTPTKPRGNLDRVGELRCPLLGIFGAQDELIPLEQVVRLRDRLQGRGHVIAYPRAGHAFMNDTRPAYRAEDAADAWWRAVTFLAKQLAPDLLPSDAGPAVPDFPEGPPRPAGGGGGRRRGGRGNDRGRRPPPRRGGGRGPARR